MAISSPPTVHSRAPLPSPPQASSTSPLMGTTHHLPSHSPFWGWEVRGRPIPKQSFWNRVSPCGPGWSWTWDPLATTSQVQGLQAWATAPNSELFGDRLLYTDHCFQSALTKLSFLNYNTLYSVLAIITILVKFSFSVKLG
jgi:hypothetical protein